MGVLGLRVDDELEKEFREEVFKRKGMKKGNITEALEEAMKQWIEEDKRLQEEGKKLAKKR